LLLTFYHLAELCSFIGLTLQEEAVEVTGEVDPEAAARAVLSRPGAKTEWCVVKEGSQGALLVSKTSPGVFQAKALKVGDAIYREEEEATAGILLHILSIHFP
jgi:sugar/nucleoside kinase (ribokinase family)